MTLEQARELIAMHVHPDSGYNRNAARVVPGEPVRDYAWSRNGRSNQARCENAFK